MSVPTFSQLLSEYLNRSGISDSELARSIGVRRQTVFRWKEGLVERPRARDDVLRCAKKLRLTAEERDLLLLAAGFPPEVLSAEAVGTTEQASLDASTLHAKQLDGEKLDGEELTEEELTEEEVDSGRSNIEEADEALAVPTKVTGGEVLQTLFTRPSSRYTASVLGGFFAVALCVWLLLPVISPPIVPQPTTYPTAHPGETLLLIAPFRGYTTNERYNVAGRIRDALVEEIAAANLISTTIALWPEEIDSPTALAPALAASDATLIIWGEYDSGRVRVNLDGQSDLTEKHDFPLSSPTELITTITTTLPKEIRILALIVLGRLLRDQGELTKAANAFERAVRLEPEDPKVLARLHLYLGYIAEQEEGDTAMAQALVQYNSALAVNPLLIDARYNRGTVHLNRSYQFPLEDPQFRADLDAAIADFTAVLRAHPDYLVAYQNRGIAYYERNGANDQNAAIADFNQIITKEPENARAYFHRALATLRGNRDDSWIEDFEQTLALRPEYYPATNGLCWGYALAQQPEIALPFCDEAVAEDPTGTSHDSRAIVYAQLGRYPAAITDFTAYLTWVQAMESPELYQRYRGPAVEAWIDQLKAGSNPFDAALLDALR